MARKTSRVNPQFLQNQTIKRTELSDLPPGSGNSVPQLRERLTIVEEIIAIRNYVQV